MLPFSSFLLKAAFLFFIILKSSSFSANISGTIGTTNNIWGPGGNVASPVTLTGDVTVPAGVTLTVKPGCVIKGANNVITINGILIINATIDSFVDISGTTTSNGIGIVFSAGSGPSKMQFVKMISPASTNAIEVNNANVDFEHVEIQDFITNGINITGANSVVKINYCTIGAKSRTFSNTNVAYSVNIDASAANANITISNSILGLEEKSTMVGLAIRGTATNTKISYTFITGPRIGTGSTETNLYLNVSPGIFDIPNIRFFLSDLAPAVDAADPNDDFSNEPTPNGGRADCGFYGGTSQATRSQLQVRKPQANESLTHGTTYKISFWGGRFACTKKVEYSLDSGLTWSNIGTVPIGDTSINWTVPNTKTGKGLIKVSYTTVNNVYDISDRFFIDSVPPSGQICDPNKTLVNPKYFACIPYSGYRTGQAPGGAEPTYAQVRQDLTILAPYTHGIRTYGTSWRNNPNMGHDYIPHMCDTLNLNLYMGIWIDNTYGDATNYANCDQAITVINQGHKSIKSVIVGNEYLLRVEQAHGNLVTAEQNLIKYINYVRSKLPSGSKIKVTTGESYPDWLLASDELIKAVDIVYWHVHPWWEGKAINIAAEWAATAHQKMKDRLAKAGVNKPMILAETGYPWGATQGLAVGSEANQAQYLKDLHAYCMSVGLIYFFFEGFDEPWKAGMEGGVGDKWGLWKADRTPHLVIQNISQLIPDCLKWEDPEVSQSTNVNKADNNITKIQHSLATSNFTNIKIFDIRGKQITSINSNINANKIKNIIKNFNISNKNIFIIYYTNKQDKVVKTEKFLID
jgi:exo-beta-1,3-glucanase (GH17 family)